MLHIIGLGLADEKDVSVKGLEVIRKAERVYLEAYTAVLLVDQAQLVGFIDTFPNKLTSTVANMAKNAVGKLLWPASHPRRPGNGRIEIRRDPRGCRRERRRVPRSGRPLWCNYAHRPRAPLPTA